jgi:hypothetical protein
LESGDGSLRVVFRWAGDRYGHEILAADGRVLTSVEGTPEASWPPSPPLQQLSKETLGDQVIVFGVGAAGKSHWSLSVDLDRSGAGPAIRFDWACRVKDPPQVVGSTYRGDQSMLELDAECIRQVDPDRASVRVEPTERIAQGTVRWSYRVTPHVPRT